jgi:phosphoserine phosphatase
LTGKSAADTYVVDVCGTLVREDTTLGLLRYHLSRRPGRRIRYRLFQALTARRSPIRLGFALAEKLLARHLLKHLAIRLLADEPIEALNRSAAGYAQALLSQGRVRSVWHLLDAPLKSARVVLASGSLEPVVAALAAEIGVDYVASSLEARDGVLTGRYATDLTGQKSRALVEKFGQSLLAGKLCAISDNLSDLPLLESATEAYVVLHAASHRARWTGLKATFLELDA